MAGLVVVWVFGAFGEEMLFRGFLINAFYKLLSANYFNDRIRWGLSLLVTSILVGFGHSYQGYYRDDPYRAHRGLFRLYILKNQP